MVNRKKQMLEMEIDLTPPRQKDPTDILAKMTYYLRKIWSSNIYVINVNNRSKSKTNNI